MKYESNIKNLVLDLKGKLKNAKDISKLQRTVAFNLMASNLYRIHTQGVSVFNASIGEYNSRNELYINPNNSPKAFAPLGKPIAASSTRAQHKVGKIGRAGKKRAEFSYLEKKDQAGKYYQHTTRWFPSYRNFRQFIGREVGFVNLQLSGRLKLDWAVVEIPRGWAVGFKSQYGSLVAAGNEKRFRKKIWGVTEQDQVMIDETVKDFISKTFDAKP